MEQTAKIIAFPNMLTPERLGRLFAPKAAPTTPATHTQRLLQYLSAIYKLPLEGGRLTARLKPHILPGGTGFFTKIAEHPELKPHIVFKDNGVERSYDDVVWPLTERSLELALLLRSNPSAGQARRIIITSAMLGSVDEDKKIDCRIIEQAGENGTLHFRPVILTDYPWDRSVKQSGAMRVIQTDHVLLERHRQNPDLYLIKISVSDAPSMSMHAPAHAPAI